MRIWFLLAGLLLAPFLAHAQDIPFSRNFRATNAANIPYSPAVAADWDGNADPGDTDDALNQLAERVDDNEGALSPLSNVVADLGTANNNINTLGAYLRNVTLMDAVEVGNAIVYSLTAVDGMGNAINILGGETVWVEAFTDAAHSVAAIPADWTLTDGGNGSLVATSAGVTKAKFQTTDVGALQVAVTDVSGVSGATLHLRWSYAAPANVPLAQVPIYTFAHFVP
jgi:hypothetical protein